LEFKRRVEPMLAERRANDPIVFWKATRGGGPREGSPPRSEQGGVRP
jgi:hypothetical protein